MPTTTSQFVTAPVWLSRIGLPAAGEPEACVGASGVVPIVRKNGGRYVVVTGAAMYQQRKSKGKGTLEVSVAPSRLAKALVNPQVLTIIRTCLEELTRPLSKQDRGYLTEGCLALKANHAMKQKDIAKFLGVCDSTVSVLLNNPRSLRLSSFRRSPGPEGIAAVALVSAGALVPLRNERLRELAKDLLQIPPEKANDASQLPLDLVPSAAEPAAPPKEVGEQTTLTQPLTGDVLRSLRESRGVKLYDILDLFVGEDSMPSLRTYQFGACERGDFTFDAAVAERISRVLQRMPVTSPVATVPAITQARFSTSRSRAMACYEETTPVGRLNVFNAWRRKVGEKRATDLIVSQGLRVTDYSAGELAELALALA